MIALALETSSPQGSLALARIPATAGFELLGEKTWLRGKSHGELATPSLQLLLQENQLDFSRLGAVFVGLGPGSFTGIRVGVSMARALGFSLNLPVWGVNSLRVWAESAADSKNPTLVVMKGFRDIVYIAVYQREKNQMREILSPRALRVNEVAPLLPPGLLSVVGDGWTAFHDLWPNELKNRAQTFLHTYPQSRSLFQIYVQEQPRLEDHLWKSAKPLYIRGSEAEEKLRLGLLKPVSEND